MASSSTTPLSGRKKRGSRDSASSSSTGSLPWPLTTAPRESATAKTAAPQASPPSSIAGQQRPECGSESPPRRRPSGWPPGRGLKPATAPRPPSPAERDPDLLQDGCPRVFALDSVSRVSWDLAGGVILGGSHGGIVNGKAIKAPVRAAFFNDAGGGKDGAGFSRLPALDVCGIPGATVSAMSARIGDGRDTYESGTISKVNASAAALGVRSDQSASEAVSLIRDAARTALAGEA